MPFPRPAAPILLVLATGVLAACAMSAAEPAAKLAPPTPVGSANWVEPPKGYLPAGGAPDGLKILPPPPAPNSRLAAAEQEIFDNDRALQGTPRWTQAIRDADLSGKEAYQGFSCAAGVQIGPETTPVLSKMMLRMIHDARLIYNPPKDFYARKRPASGNTAPICVPREDWIETNGSYPSGHSLIGYSWSLVLAELVPDRATEITTRGRELGDSRAVCGVHWVSDIQAGRTLAAVLVARLHAEPGFQAELATAKAEIAQARTLGAPKHCPAA